MVAQLPSQCSTALKEWATVLEAMARGQQLVMIRKGGLIEPGAGFDVASPVFAFYPTFEHQAVNYLREPFRPYFDAASARRAPDGSVRFELIGQVVDSVRSHDPAIVDRLREFHIYNEAFLTQRLKWQPETPLTIVVVRAFRLATPAIIAVTPQYAGCKSWVELDAPVSLEGALPVMDEETFAAKLTAIHSVLG
jgi:hypothetical protein